MVGLLEFIGEIFNHGLLAGAVIDIIIKQLLGQDGQVPSQDHVEFLCSLLKRSGKNIIDEQKLDQYFDRIKTLSRSSELPKRHRFMLMDMMDLRRDNWVPRIKQEKAKTIEDVHKDLNVEKGIMPDSGLMNAVRTRVVQPLIESGETGKGSAQDALQNLVQSAGNLPSHVVQCCALISLEKSMKPEVTRSIHQVITALVQSDIIAKDSLQSGLQRTLVSILHDSEKNSANSKTGIFKRFGALIGRCISDGTVPIDGLFSIFKETPGKQLFVHTANIVIHMLHTLVELKKLNHNDILRMMVHSSFNMIHFIDPTDRKAVEKFVDLADEYDVHRLDPVCFTVHSIIRQYNGPMPIMRWVKRQEDDVRRQMARRVIVATIASIELLTTFSDPTWHSNDAHDSSQSRLEKINMYRDLFTNLMTANEEMDEQECKAVQAAVLDELVPYGGRIMSVNKDKGRPILEAIVTTLNQEGFISSDVIVQFSKTAGSKSRGHIQFAKVMKSAGLF